MNISIFDVAGPVMIGPSSSHTAGAARLGRIARNICHASFQHVSFGLYGSFAKTYKGHGTDLALLAGILDIHESDERLPKSFDYARKAGITYDFYEVNLEEAGLEKLHENSVSISFYNGKELVCNVVGSSVGGGRIRIVQINDFSVDVIAELPTLIIRHWDEKGIIKEIAGVLAGHDLNIGTMKLSRQSRGETACCVIEMDETISDEVVMELHQLKGMISVQAINPEKSDLF